MLRPSDIAVLACPGCRGKLSFAGSLQGGRLFRGTLSCASCGRPWSVRDGLVDLHDDAALSLKERLMRSSYDRFGRFHDPLVRLVFPLLREETAQDNRDRYLSKLDLLALAPRPDGRPVRVLEVGVGSGDDIPVLRRHLPPDVAAEIWGVDVSIGMLRVLRPKLDRQDHADVRILMGDAHALPFVDHAFDRVFHVGAANSYRNPKLALAEMARVAAPGSPIVVVDEWLEEGRPPRLRDRLIHFMLTAYDWNLPHPTTLVPPDVTEVRMEQLNPVFYCLSFRTPTRPLAIT